MYKYNNYCWPACSKNNDKNGVSIIILLCNNRHKHQILFSQYAKKIHGATIYFFYIRSSSMLGKVFSLLKPLILFVNALVALRQGWNIARSGRNIQFWEDNKATTLSISISKMGRATFRSGSSLHDENEVKRRKPRWLSARPPMPRSPSFSLEFNKNPRASGIELATRRRSPGFPSENIMRFDSYLGASPFDSISPYFS